MRGGATADTHSLLIVGDGREDARTLANGLRRHGHQVLGPVETVEDALAVLDGTSPPDGAVFDLPLDTGWSSPIAEALRRRGVPFVFTVVGADTTGGPSPNVSPDPTRIVDMLFRRPASVAGNTLLARMPPGVAAALAPHLVATDLGPASVLQEPDKPAEQVHFPSTAILSVVGPASTRRPGAEIALIGFEGMTGIPEVLDGEAWPFATIVQVGGETLAMDAGRFRTLLTDRRDLRDFLLRYVQAFLVQTGDTALANARGVLSQRLARRVLMTHDRAASDVLPLTHQQLATMLGVRRASVTEALHLFEGDGIVRSLRGRLLVRNRAALLEVASGYYGTAEAAYERLIGSPTHP
ncbi:MAG: helix-turn-helix domain-containing protein [Bauldia sp.]|nr:helix-turn-helix domain-containing protein [Bauldia sp.]MCW5719108.1 helix-turn-helix domain-containing protein [Bauldia sp.]